MAISQAVTGFGVEGQGWDEMLEDQHWDTAAEVGAQVVQAVIDLRSNGPVVLNVNVPNVLSDEVLGWRRTAIAALPPRALADARLVPKPGHDNVFDVQMDWGDPQVLPDDTDSGAVEAGYVSITALSRIADDRDVDLSPILNREPAGRP